MHGAQESVQSNSPHGDTTPPTNAGSGRRTVSAGDFGLRHPLQPIQNSLDVSDRSVYRSWIEGLVAGLSPRGQAIVDSAVFSHLKDVPNSACRHSRLLSHVDVDRWEHSIHAAHSIREFHKQNPGQMSERDAELLECLMLVHDIFHRRGSHSLDRVFASMPGSPPIRDWGWGEDFHEYHGVQLIAKDPELSSILGELHADVLAILASPDTRSEAERASDFGAVSTMDPQRISLFAHVKDEFDRYSYLTLDWARSGFASPLIQQVLQDLKLYVSALALSNNELRLILSKEQHSDGAESGLPHHGRVVQYRQVFRRHFATHPVSCLIDEVLKLGVWQRQFELFPGEMGDRRCYESVRDAARDGRYENIFSKDVLEMLDAHAREDGYAPEDVFAPLAVVAHKHLSHRGDEAMKTMVTPSLAEALCGFPRQDMSVLEANIRQALAGTGAEVLVLRPNDYEKELSFKLCHRHHDEQSFEETVHGLCDPETRRIIIAARAIDRDGDAVHLGRAKSRVMTFLDRSGYMNRDVAPEPYNPRLFVDLAVGRHFSEEVIEKAQSIEPAWIRLGGCGLIPREPDREPAALVQH